MSDDNDEMEAVEEEMEDEKNHPQNDGISQLQRYISQHNQYHSSSHAHSSSLCLPMQAYVAGFHSYTCHSKFQRSIYCI